MTQLLDEIEKPTVFKKTFSRLSFGFTLLTIALFIYIHKQSQLGLTFTEDGIPINPIAFRFSDYATFLANFVGFILAVISLLNKEPTTLLKWIGVIFNVGFFMLLVGIYIYFSV